MDRIVANTPLMCYRFPYTGADLCLASAQPDARLHCKTTDPYGLVYHAMCLFTPPAFAVYSLRLPSTHGEMARTE